MPFEKNVFINCPFDPAYIPILRPIIFTIIYLGFQPRIALERLDSGETRITKIVSFINESKYAIHDLSRLKAKAKDELFRLNMPFELGLDVGCRLFKTGQWASKKCLILEAEHYRYQAAISDLSNSDIAIHNDQPEKAAIEVRNWLNNQDELRAPGPSKVWGAFNDFMAYNFDALILRGFSNKDIKNLPIAELITCMQDWCSTHT